MLQASHVSRALQQPVNRLRQLQTHGFWLSCLKYAVSLLGFSGAATCEHAADALPASARAATRQAVQQQASPLTA